MSAGYSASNEIGCVGRWDHDHHSRLTFIPQSESRIEAIGLLCLVFSVVGAPSSGSWAVVGVVIKRYLSDPFWQRCYSWTMVLLIMYTAIAKWFL